MRNLMPSACTTYLQSKRTDLFHQGDTETRRNAIRVAALGLLTVALIGGCVAQTTAASSSPAKANSGQAAPGLDNVLNQMDAAAAQFRTAEADFSSDQYQRVVNETDTQKGKIYFRRTNKGETQMASDIQSPDKKYLLLINGKMSIYQPKIEQVNEYDAGKNRSELESFLLLGFGGRGHDLQKQFD